MGAETRSTSGIWRDCRVGIAPDGKTLWINSKSVSRVYAYSLSDLKLLGGIPVGDHPDWLTFTPDSKSVYIANETAFQKSRPRFGLGRKLSDFWVDFWVR